MSLLRDNVDNTTDEYVEISSTRQSTRTLYTRLVDLGPISLLELFLGGLILILTAINTLVRPDDQRPFPASSIRIEQTNAEALRFHIGHTWSVQIWLAIVGAGFGLLSHGFYEARVHLFDWWCSRQAQGPSGLDYARYLNSQSRSPVTYGVRGFWTFASMRYFLVCATIGTSIGYKFGVVETSAPWTEAVDGLRTMMMIRNMTTPYSDDKRLSPWFKGSQQCFTYTYQTIEDSDSDTHSSSSLYDDTREGIFRSDADHTKPPLNVIMAGELSTSYYLTDRDSVSGYLTTREVVALAEMVTEEQGDEDDLTMSADQGDWFRVETMGTNWTTMDNDTTIGTRVVVDYRIAKPGKVQIQWAPTGPWFTDEDAAGETQKVTKRVTYNTSYATAEVDRAFDFSAQGYIGDEKAAIILGKGRGEFPAARRGEDHELLRRAGNWVDAQVSDEASRVADGVSAILRAIMYGWALSDAQAAGVAIVSQWDTSSSVVNYHNWGPWTLPKDGYDGEYIRLLPMGEFPLGDEHDGISRRDRYFSDLIYPYFNGYRHRGLTGCYVPAAGAFLAVGILAWIAMGLRIWAGPAVLTSWTGQHVYLSQIGVISGLERQEELSSGYMVAPARLGTLHLRREGAGGRPSGGLGQGIQSEIELRDRKLSKSQDSS